MNKQEKANFLFEEMGEIDESILKECWETFPAAHKKKQHTWRILVASVALLSVFIITVSGVGIASIVDVFSPVGDSKETPSSITSSSDNGFVTTTSNVLLFDSEILFSGTPSLIYLDEEETLCAVKISTKDYSAVKQFSASPKRRVQPNDSPTTSIWVSDGTGMVFTPYLENTTGNTYYGQIFDYRDEVVPNDKLSALLDQLLPNS